MNGNMSFEDALQARLAIIKPSKKIVDSFNSANPPKISPYVKELIQKFHNKQVPVYLVSGGFHAVSSKFTVHMEYF
jgi:phosphoserine phosphatase